MIVLSLLLKVGDYNTKKRAAEIAALKEQIEAVRKNLSYVNQNFKESNGNYRTYG